MSEEVKKHIEDLCDRVAAQLAEHCDSVQIFVTKQLEDGSTNTLSYESGRGNFYARQGQIEEWLVFQKEYQKREAIRRDAAGREEA